MKKAVIYARYSCSGQTEQSIEGQLRVCREYAKSNDMLIMGEYIDRAMTGTNDARPNFQRMIKDSNKREWDVVLVYKLDRFSRNKYDSAINKHALKLNDVRVVSATEHIPDSPEAVVFESMLEGMAQYYSEELSQKVHRGLAESYRKGNFTGGYQVLGYDTIDKKCVVNETEAEIICEVFTKYAGGYTAKAIADELTARGVRGKRNRVLTAQQILWFLGNTKYNGKIRHGDTIYENIYPKIIDDRLWAAVQEIRAENLRAPSRKKDAYNYILSGKVVCGYCKENIVGISGTGKMGVTYYYYACLSRRRKIAECKAKSISKQELEDIVVQTTWKLLANEETVAFIADAIVKLHEKNARECSQRKGLEAERAAALKASDNLIAAMEQGIITEQTKKRLKELEEEIARLDFAIEEEKQRTYSYLTVEMVTQYLHGAIYGDIDDMGVKKLLVKHFIREVQVYNDHILIVYSYTNDSPKHPTKSQSRTIEKACDDPQKGVPLSPSLKIDKSCSPKESYELRTIFLLSRTSILPRVPAALALHHCILGTSNCVKSL